MGLPENKLYIIKDSANARNKDGCNALQNCVFYIKKKVPNNMNVLGKA